jgi:hypothetical protein
MDGFWKKEKSRSNARLNPAVIRDGFDSLLIRSQHFAGKVRHQRASDTAIFNPS